jgi:hypothetical protein
MSSPLRLVVVTLAFGLAVGTFAGPTNASEFSADIVSRDATGAVSGGIGKLYMADRKVRIEAPDLADGFFLVDSGREAAVFVRPAQRLVMDAKQSTPLTQIFLPVDPKDPCPEWRAAAIEAGVAGADGDWRCERIDTSLSDDRSKIEYRVLSPDGQTSDRWIDSALSVAVKLRTGDGRTIALEHEQFEKQPASLFEIPTGYRKFDPQALIERIKHSDVWVEPPK